jgi:UDP-N-acetylmuramyl pentapeptide synthase
MKGNRINEREIMNYGLKHKLAVLRMPIGRRLLMARLWRRSWPFLARLAFVYRRTVIRKTRVITVVGSFGKSTTTCAILTTLGLRIHPRSTSNSYDRIARAILRIRHEDAHGVLEVGIDGPGQMATYASIIRPDITVVTSIGSEHNRSLKTLEITRAEKSEMVRMLPTSGLAVLNGDDPNVLWMKNCTSARVLTFGIDRTHDIFATNIKLDWPNGTKFNLHANGETHEVRSRLIGRHMVYAVLAAVAVSLAEGFSIDQAISALETLSPTPMRLEPILLPNGAYILRDEFKSSLETIEAALDVFKEIPAQRRIAVLGQVSEPPGSQGPIYRQIGETIAKIASYAIFIGGNYQRYAAGAARGGLPRDALINSGRSFHGAVDLLRMDLKRGDVVLIKGRDNQKLERVTLSLMGRKVSCDISFCDLKLRCELCPMLEKGWVNLNVTMQ